MNNLVNNLVTFLVANSSIGFAAYNAVYTAVKSQRLEDGKDFSDEALWNGEYTTRVSSKGIVTDTLDSQARRWACSTFKGYDPKSGKPKFETDAVAVISWDSTIKRLVAGGIRDEATYLAANEASGGPEHTLRNCLTLGRIALFAKRVAKVFGLRGKTAVKTAFSAFAANPGELAELHAKTAVAQMVDSTIKYGTLYTFSSETLPARIEAARIEANKLQDAPLATATDVAKAA